MDGTLLSLASDGASVVIIQPASRTGAESGNEGGGTKGEITRTEGVSVLSPGVRTKSGSDLLKTGKGSGNRNLSFRVKWIVGGREGRGRLDARRAVRGWRSVCGCFVGSWVGG